MIVGCPTCGAEVEFRYDDSFVRVCGHCRAAVVRTDRGVETLGQFADLVPIDSPLKLFADGRYGSTSFLLVGMAQLRHAAGGVWQEWYAKLDGGQWAWISEAQGRLYLTFERPGIPLPPRNTLVAGARVDLAGTPYTVAEVGTATYISALGEIPYRLQPNTTFMFADLADGRGGFATIDYGDGVDDPVAYIGYQVTPQGLGISGGETQPQLAKPQQGARLACPNCNGSLELRAPDQTLRVACPYCNTLVSVEGGTLSVIARQAKKPTTVIPLGTKGKFTDGELTVIGYVARSAYVDATWWPFEEYLLYAPGVGFRWLVCSDGHWSYVQPVATGAVELGLNARYEKATFRRFQIADLRVDAVLGELYWRVTAGERVSSEDYIAPPAMLSREYTKAEQNWSLSTYMTERELNAAFGKAFSWPRPSGIAPNQPYPAGIGKVMALVTVAFLALGAGKCAASKGTTQLHQSFTVVPPGALPAPAVDPSLGVVPGSGAPPAESEPAGNVMFSDKFHLDGGRNIAFELHSSVDNNWVYVALDLFNEATGSVVSIDKSIEYYHGYEDGESWTEGSQTESEVIGPVEAGDYVLRIEAQQGGKTDVPFDVVVKQGVFRWLWFGVFFGVLAIPYGLVLAHAISFQKRRWSTSNLVPHGGSDD